MRSEIAAGVIPAILEACPIVAGLTRENFSSTSRENPGIDLYSKCAGIVLSSSFLNCPICCNCLRIYPSYFTSSSTSSIISEFNSIGFNFDSFSEDISKIFQSFLNKKIKVICDYKKKIYRSLINQNDLSKLNFWL